METPGIEPGTAAKII